MRTNTWIVLIAAAAAALASCSNEHGTEPGPFEFDAPPMPTNLVVTPGVETATLSWEYPPGRMGELEEFRVYYYFPTFDAVELAGTTTDTVYVDEKLVGNVEYCYKVSAVDTVGMEGWRSGEECAVIDSR